MQKLTEKSIKVHYDNPLKEAASFYGSVEEVKKKYVPHANLKY